MLLGKVIQNQRKKLQLSQAELADGICTQAIISKMENQNISPSTNVLISVCQKLHLTLDNVFSQFSSLPSSNLYLDKFQAMDQAVQDKKTTALESMIAEIKEGALPSSEKAHLHFLLALLAESKKDSDEAVFQLNYSLELLQNRKTFWGTIIYSELGSVYLDKNQRVKTNYYYDLAYSNINNITVNSSTEFYYYRSVITKIATWYMENNNFERSDSLIDMGLHKFDKYFTGKFTDVLYFTAAQNALNSPPIDYNRLSHSLTTSIAFAEYNNNQALLDEIKQLMSKHNINELKIKP
ncbi:helix-turn-helix domain-containing protein [Companilactobacillus jidongensis]|uniref:helix-turn-helix domain-containing protein n=1 Tax=Companilactobacillus jidongensis TaxID=2486006 RepID=UPI000F7AAC82|nr:helix-turn-helix transcriptional regulator [Companilactobacillus jidongensis]